MNSRQIALFFIPKLCRLCYTTLVSGFLSFRNVKGVMLLKRNLLYKIFVALIAFMIVFSAVYWVFAEEINPEEVTANAVHAARSGYGGRPI